MERLTKRWGNNPAVPTGFYLDFILDLNDRDSNGLQAVFERLCDFEDKLERGGLSEVAHGKWLPASDKPGVQIGMKCSLCKARISYSEFYNGNHMYCHKCGAKMDLEE
jgi:hypothetical protein